MATNLFQKNTLVRPINIYDTPLDYILKCIQESLDDPQNKSIKTLVLESGTGSGKSVSVAPEIQKKIQNGLVLLIQPRVLVTKNLANDIARFYPEYILGKNIGFITGDMSVKIKKGILLITYGSLLQLLLTQTARELFQMYSCVIFDEIHERELEIDLILSQLQHLLLSETVSDLPPLIFMSATFDLDKFCNFLGTADHRRLSVKGIQYDIEDIFLETPSLNLNADVEKLILQLSQDAIIFVEGTKRIRDVTEIIHKLNFSAWKQNKSVFAPIAVDATIIRSISQEYKRIFLKSITQTIFDENEQIVAQVPNAIKIFLATNALETGITIRSLVHCIDLGIHRAVMYDYRSRGVISLIKAIAQDNAIQRRGRIGRTQKGIWHAMYTKATFDQMESHMLPKILVSNLERFWLNLIDISEQSEFIKTIIPSKAVRSFLFYNTETHAPEWYYLSHKKKFKFTEMRLFDFPDVLQMCSDISFLHDIHFVTSAQTLSPEGKLFLRNGYFSARNFRMLLSAYFYNANLDWIINLIVWDIKRQFEWKFKNDSDEAWQRFLLGFDTLNNLILKLGVTKACQQLNVTESDWIDLLTLKYKLHEILLSNGMRIYSEFKPFQNATPNDIANIKAAIVDAYYDWQIAATNNNKYRFVTSNVAVKIFDRKPKSGICVPMSLFLQDNGSRFELQAKSVVHLDSLRIF